MSGRMEHDSRCREPLNEHTGSEPCIRWVEEEESEPFVVAHYTQGPQGNTVADYYADHLARSGPVDKTRPLGTVGITDRRDARDPEAVGMEILANKNGHTMPVHDNPRFTTHQ